MGLELARLETEMRPTFSATVYGSKMRPSASAPHEEVKSPADGESRNQGIASILLWGISRRLQSVICNFCAGPPGAVAFSLPHSAATGAGQLRSCYETLRRARHLP